MSSIFPAVTIALCLMSHIGCTKGLRRESGIPRENVVYAKEAYNILWNEAINNREAIIKLKDGIPFAQNYLSANDTDSCLVGFIFSRNWAVVGYRYGFSRKVMYQEKNWELTLFAEFKNMVCSDKVFSAVFEKSLDIERFKGFVALLNKEKINGFILSDLMTESENAIKVRPILIGRVGGSGFPKVAYPTEAELKKLNIQAAKMPQKSEAPSYLK